MPAPMRDEVQRMFESGNFIAAIKRRQYQNPDGSPGKKFLYIDLQRRKATGEIAQHLALFSSDNRDEVKEHILEAVSDAIDAGYELVDQYKKTRQEAFEARNARYNNRRRYEDEGDAGSGNKAVEDAPVEDNIGNKDSSDSIFKKVTGNLFSGNGK